MLRIHGAIFQRDLQTSLLQRDRLSQHTQRFIRLHKPNAGHVAQQFLQGGSGARRSHHPQCQQHSQGKAPSQAGEYTVLGIHR